MAWSKSKFGNFAKEMRDCRNEMNRLIEESQTNEVIEKMRALDNRMEELESREEQYWKQRSRQDWLKGGDKNSSFFHTKTKQRRDRNNITSVWDRAGNEYSDEDQMAETFASYFEELFTSGKQADPSTVSDLIQPMISSELSDMLAAPFTGEEVRMALDQMHPTKAPGPDGMCALFYQKFWPVVGKDVISKVLNILNNGDDVGPINNTYIALIPKKKKCETPADFRPISLCNVLYKLVSKALANRIKTVLPIIIHESQSGFVPGRLITDNILVAYECFHYLRKKKHGKMGHVGLKLDMSKAYDRVEWNFLENMMLKMGFPSCFVKCIMNCVTSSSFSVLINGQPSRRFSPSRGLRQGDPLSPFLFIICAEGLSRLLKDAERRKVIHGLKIGKHVQPITHLFFADDSLLFVRATEGEIEAVMEILSKYEMASGQKLNLEKSEISFSRNIEQEKKNMLQRKLSFKAVEEYEKYLGLPTYVGSSKKKVFQIIQDKVWKKLKGWKEKFLSQAGRETLIKSIAQAIPTYAMQVFRIPEGILQTIEKMIRGFYWGQRADEKKINWIAWKKLINAKSVGGLGFRDMQVFNSALLAKQAWRVLTNEGSYMTKILKSKYFPNSSFMRTKVAATASYTWRSILSARELLEKGIRKVVGNGRSIDVWQDPWVPGLQDYKLKPREQIPEDYPRMVSDLLEHGQWKEELLDHICTEEECKAIIKIPLSMGSPDFWSWSHTKDGRFSVRSAYFVELNKGDTHNASSRTMNKEEWSKVWLAAVPPKVQHFGWRVLHNSIPVRVNLTKRGVQIEDRCPQCGEAEETILHMLFECQEVRQIWRLSPLRLEYVEEGHPSLNEWFVSLTKRYTEKLWWSIFWSLSWGIWLKRNAWCFEQKRIRVEDTINRAVGLVGDFEKANEKIERVSTTTTLASKWSAPAQGSYKVNSDVAFLENMMMGFGMVVRDHVGDVLMSSCLKLKGVDRIDVAEAMALRHAVKIAIEAGFRAVVVETDCMRVFTHLKNKLQDNSEFGSIINDIRLLGGGCSSFSVSHVKRSGNVVAHSLAKLCSQYEGLIVWMEEVPAPIQKHVQNDCSHLIN
ncbi:LINE-1 reverse transcriptase-like protein [Bienertia sinuspersici]